MTGLMSPKAIGRYAKVAFSSDAITRTRPAEAVRLVKVGCSSKEVAADPSHASLRDIARYESRRTGELARRAIA